MSSWFSLIDLYETLATPGCPICQVRKKAARQYVSFLLNESITNVHTRARLSAGVNYCPEHTRLLVDLERIKGESPLRMNILFESLAGSIMETISKYPIPRKRSNFLQMSQSWIFSDHTSEKTPKHVIASSTCQVCQITDDVVIMRLASLMECLQDPNDTIYTAYRDNDGICLFHLRLALQRFAQRYPSAAEILKEHAVERLQQWENAMQEYIRKQAWHNRHETITDDEKLALQRTLAFFTGYPPKTFAVNEKRKSKDE
jgi:hypothetical protein